MSSSPLPDRVLPQNLEAEKAVLGAVLIDNKAFPHVAPILKPADFFRRAHQRIYAAMMTLIDERRVDVDAVTMKAELKRLGELDECGGPAYIASLTDGVPRSSNVAYYAGIVKESATLRSLIFLANDLLVEAYNAEARSTELLGKADRAVLNLQRGSGTSELVDLSSANQIAELHLEIERRVQNKGILSGLDTGFESLNDLTSGWQSTDMIVIAARPSIGKTAFVLNTLLPSAKAGKRVAVFSLEMSRRQLELRLLAILSGVSLEAIMKGYLGEQDYERLSSAMSVLHDLKIFVEDRGDMNALDIRSACRRMRAEGGVDLVIIDYVQLIPGTLERRGATRNEEVTEISRRLKSLAKEIGAPVIVLSQLNRASDNRPDKTPILTDLRESGAIEQDADLVMFLHRKHHDESGTTKAILKKARNGPTGSVNLTIHRDTQIFTDGGDDSEPDAQEKQPEPRSFEFSRRSDLNRD